MNHTPFSQLADLAPRVGVPGLSAADALAEFHAALDKEAIPAGRLIFSGYPSSAPVPGCSLVCEGTVLLTKADIALRMLSGTGHGYTGLLDRCANDLPRALLESVMGESSEPAPLGRSIGLCIRLLDAPLGTLAPRVHAVIQRHLSTLLLDNPSLLHPAFLVPRRNGTRTEFVGIASALASSAQGSLPRYCHFHPDEAPASSPAAADDRQLVAKLEAFARNPCVIWALSEKSVRVEGADQVGSTCGIAVKREVLQQALFRTLSPRPEFLASVIELDELAFPRLRTDKALPFAHAITSQERWKHQIVTLLGRSAYAAFGSLHSHLEGTNGWTPFHRKDAWFLSAIKARQPEFGANLFKTLGAGIQRWLFPPGATPAPPRLMAANLACIVDGLVECGLVDSKTKAATFLMEHCIGKSRPEGRLPPTTPAVALSLLSSLERYGVGPAALHQLQSALACGGSGSHADDWRLAVDAIETERRMGSLLTQQVDPLGVGQGIRDSSHPIVRMR